MTRYITAHIHDGWGNQMFIVAALLGYAEKYGHTPVFLTEPVKSKDHSESQLRIQDFVSIPVRPELSSLTWTVLKEAPQNAFTYTELPFVEGNVCLDGYFQSAKYFPKTPNKFSQIPVPAELNMELMGNDWSSTFFLHIRRGDYMHAANAHHQIPVQRYLEICLPTFITGNKATCFVASDDIPWCKQMLPTWFPDSSISWLFCPKEVSDAETVFWMSLCGAGGICANSSFSWWAAYFLRLQQKPLCMPYPWGKPPLPEARDLYPPWCLKINWMN